LNLGCAQRETLATRGESSARAQGAGGVRGTRRGWGTQGMRRMARKAQGEGVGGSVPSGRKDAQQRALPFFYLQHL